MASAPFHVSQVLWRKRLVIVRLKRFTVPEETNLLRLCEAFIQTDAENNQIVWPSNLYIMLRQSFLVEPAAEGLSIRRKRAHAGAQDQVSVPAWTEHKLKLD